MSTMTSASSSTYPSTSTTASGTPVYTTSTVDSSGVSRPGVAVGQTVSDIAQGINNTLASIAKTGAAAVGINPSPNEPGVILHDNPKTNTTNKMY